MELTGMTALVTGASSGIGRATALALARRGVRVRATGLEEDGLADVARRCGAEVLAADLSADGELERILAWAGTVDLLVNSAGFGWFGPLRDMDGSVTAEMLTVNLGAPIRLTAALAPAMVAGGRGHIVTVASIAGYAGVPGEAGYSASKAGLLAFCESVRTELAGSGVGVTVVVPAAVDTGFFAREGRAYTRRWPRLVGPEKVAETIVAAVERGRPEVFVPRWLVVPARLHGAAPRLFARLASRSW
jgi:short-subunit dehydrogenase